MINSKFPLDGAVLDQFCKTWIGSGDRNAEIVFVGLEFSSEAKTQDSIVSFFEEIKKLNYPSLISDYIGFVISHTKKWYKQFDFLTSPVGAKNPTRQWMSIMSHCIKNKIIAEKKIKNENSYQVFEQIFANQKSSTASLELFALPCQSLKESDYKYSNHKWVDISKYPQFIDKKTYKNYYFEQRKKSIKIFIENPSTKYIILYSLSFKKVYEEILDINFDNGVNFLFEKKQYFLLKKDNKLFILMPHFSVRGFSYSFLNNILEQIFLMN